MNYVSNCQKECILSKCTGFCKNIEGEDIPVKIVKMLDVRLNRIHDALDRAYNISELRFIEAKKEQCRAMKCFPKNLMLDLIMENACHTKQKDAYFITEHMIDVLADKVFKALEVCGIPRAYDCQTADELSKSTVKTFLIYHYFRPATITRRSHGTKTGYIIKSSAEELVIFS